MSRRIYRPEDFEFTKNKDEDYIPWMEKAGSTFKIAGLLIQGEGYNILATYPNASEHNAKNVINESFTAETLNEFLKRTDDPLIFEQDETGTIKTVIRKAERIVSGDTQQKIWVRDNLICMFCGRPMGEVSLTIDHFIPIELGGADRPDNYISACRKCNKNKGGLHPEEYCKSKGLDYSGLVRYLSHGLPRSFIGHLK